MTDSIQESIEILKKAVTTYGGIGIHIQAVLAELDKTKTLSDSWEAGCKGQREITDKLSEELDKHRTFMKAYYKWALKETDFDSEEFENMVTAAEAIPPEE